VGEPRRYRIYVLRLRLSEAQPPQWQISLEDVRTRERIAFATVEDFVAYLEALSSSSSSVPDQASPLETSL
jgi:hypothetical protein